MATWQTMMFQDASMPMMFFLIFLHEYIMNLLMFIMTIITYTSYVQMMSWLFGFLKKYLFIH